MATILAAANGNWSASGTWTSGIIPGSGDVVYANGKTVTVNINAICLEARNDNGLGGYFSLPSGITFTATNFYANTAVTYTPCVDYNSIGTGIISGTIYANANTNSQAVGTVRNSGPGTLVINGNVNGTTTGGTTYVTVLNNGGGTITVNGNVSGGTSGGVGIIATNGTIIINGNITGGNSISMAAGSVFIANSGVISGNSTAATVLALNSGTINSTISGPSVASAPSIVYSYAGTLTVNGLIIGGPTNAAALQNSSNGTIIANNIIGGSVGVGLTNTSVGTVIVTGTATGGSGNVAISNTSTGAVYCNLAKGNGYGIGSVGLTSQVGLYNASIGNCYVSGIEFGDLGQAPVYGPIQFLNSSSNTCSMYRPSGLSKKVLVDITNVSGLLPKTTDVRKNVSYNLGNNIGSLSMPSSGSVAFGVPVDNTTGIAILSSASQIWDYPSSNITGVNSIGNRLKNCSTVENLGSQLSNALSAINS
jgi:hypothetical protein